jgi:hypothetical protein
MKQLFKLSVPQDIRTWLGRLPRDLKEAYDATFDAIGAQLGSAPAVAFRAFRWVMCARQPLKPSDLVTAACQDPDAGGPCDVNIDIDFLLEACNNLLVVNKEQNTCSFAHLSVQEYLETHVWKDNEANTYIAKVCLMLLNGLENM